MKNKKRNHYILIACMTLLLLLSACSEVPRFTNAQGAEGKKVRLSGVANVQAKDCETEKLLEDLCVGSLSSWRQQNDYYFLGLWEEEPENVYALFHFHEDSGTLDRTELDLRDKNLSMEKSVRQAYVDDKGCLHAICFSYDRWFTLYWACSFDKSGRLTEKKELTRNIFSILNSYGKVEHLVIWPNGNFAFSYFDLKDRQHVAMLSADGKQIFDQKYDGTVRDLYRTDDDKLLVMEAMGSNATFHLWRTDVQTGLKEVILRDVPFDGELRIASGTGSEDVLFFMKNALWEYEDGSEEIRQIIRLKDVEELSLGTEDVFRTSDGSWAAFTLTEKQQGAEETRRQDHALIRIKAK